MNAPQFSTGNEPHRRDTPRVKLAVDGNLMGIEGRQLITILDLSQNGARVAFHEPPKEKAGFLRWMEFETFGDVVWREGLYVGLKFDAPIPAEWVRTTSDRVTDADSYRHSVLLKEAKEWIGPGN